MLKNKIYKYFFNEIFKNFTTVLLTFTAIAWVVRAVNFLDLMVEDGYGSSIYFKYSLLNITTIITRFVPLAFLISLLISIIKFERQQELLILWTTGLAKTKIANIFLLIGIIVTVFQLTLSLIVNPYLLNKSRSLLSETGSLEMNSVLKSGDFSDAYDGVTFYIDHKNDNNELINIFIKDTGGKLGGIVNSVEQKKNSTIIAKKGFLSKDKLILFDGTIQTLNKRNELSNVRFEKTELSLSGMTTRSIKLPKLQETPSGLLIKCVVNKNYSSNVRNCSENYKTEAIQTITRRLGAPLYIPLISIIISFLLIYKKENKFNFLKKYTLFIFSFIALIFSEILLKYAGSVTWATTSYFLLPIGISFLLYVYLIKKMMSEKL